MKAFPEGDMEIALCYGSKTVALAITNTAQPHRSCPNESLGVHCSNECINPNEVLVPANGSSN